MGVTVSAEIAMRANDERKHGVPRQLGGRSSSTDAVIVFLVSIGDSSSDHRCES